MRPMLGRFANLVSFDFRSFDGRDALRGAVITALITAAPVSMGNAQSAIPLSIGAVFAAVSEAGEPFGRRWRTMLGTTAALMFAAALGSVLSDASVAAIIVTAPVAFICGLSGAIGKRAGVGGLLALVIFSIYVGIPVPMDDALSTAALIGVGGGIQTLATVLMGLIRGSHRVASGIPSPTIPLRSRLASPIFLTHAFRLAIVMTIATAISENFALPHPYWLPMSVAWMSKPDRDGTVDRVLHRLTGTVLGLLVTTAIAIALPMDTTGFLILSLLGAAVAIAFIWANYAVAVTGVTIWVVSLFGMVGDPVVSTIEIRLGATIAASILVLLAVWLMPSLHPRNHEQSDH